MNLVFSQNIEVSKEIALIRSIKDSEKAILHIDSIMQYDFEQKDRILLILANKYVEVGKHNKAHTIYRNYINSHRNDASYNLTLAFVGFGITNNFFGNKEEATKYAFRAIKLSEELNNKHLQAISITLLSLVYFENKDFKNAIKLSKEAIILHKINNNLDSIAPLYNNISVYYYRLNLLDSFKVYNLKHSELNKTLGYSYRRVFYHNNNGLYYFKKKQYKKAIEQYLKAVKTNKEINGSHSFPYTNIAIAALKLKDFKKAEKYALLALDINLKKNSLKKIKGSYSDLLKIFLEEKNFEQAIYYQIKRDSMHSLDISNANKNQLSLIKSQKDNSIKERALAQQIAINKKNNIIYVVFLALLLILGLYVFQQKNNNQLMLKQEKLVLEQKVLRSQMNPHFIFNALTSIQKHLLEDDLLKSSTSLSKFAKIIRQNFEFTNKEIIGLGEDISALKNYIEIQQERFEDTFDYQINIQKDINLSHYKIPPMLLQPFVENAIEHGLKAKKEKGELIINILSNNPTKLRFEIIDDGIGFKKKTTKDKREHAIDIFLKRLKLRGFNEEDTFKIEALKIGTKISFTLKL